VIVVDTNVLVALAERRDFHHTRCRDWFAACDESLIVPPSAAQCSLFLLAANVAMKSRAAVRDRINAA
jgi:predicted nucleic acid-binding protein